MTRSVSLYGFSRKGHAASHGIHIGSDADSTVVPNDENDMDFPMPLKLRREEMTPKHNQLDKDIDQKHAVIPDDDEGDNIVVAMMRS